MSELEQINKKMKDLEETYSTIKKQRVIFTNECFMNKEPHELYDNEICSGIDNILNPDFIDYICENEGLEGYKYINKRFRKDKEITGDIYYKLTKIRRSINKYGCRYFEDYVSYLNYEDWQKFKYILLLIKKYLSDFIVNIQRVRMKNLKEKICNLTDCFKNKNKRNCELCGNDVENEAIYCNKCGGMIS